jgi:hypothetical protein
MLLALNTATQLAKHLHERSLAALLRCTRGVPSCKRSRRCGSADVESFSAHLMTTAGSPSGAAVLLNTLNKLSWRTVPRHVISAGWLRLA